MNGLRNSGVDVVGDVSWGTHFCQFYESKDDLIDMVVPYFKSGLENNEFCMWVTSEYLNVKDAKIVLRNAVPDIDRYLEEGQIEIIPYSEWYVTEDGFNCDRIINGWVDKLNNGLNRGFDGLRLSGDTYWLEKYDWDDFIKYEKEVGKVIHNYRIMALCTYYCDKINTRDIIDIVNNHQFAVIKRNQEWKLLESSLYNKTKEKLEESRDKYRYLFNNMLDGYAHCKMIYDNNGHPNDFIYLNVNEAFKRLTGLSNVENKKISEIIPGTKETYPELFEIYERVASTSQPEKFEINFKPLNKWFMIGVYSPQKDQFMAVFEDITKRKDAEENNRRMLEIEKQLTEKLQNQQEELYKVNRDLFESKEKFAKAFHNNPASMALVDLNGIYIDINETFSKLTGYSKIELIGHSITELNIFDPEKIKHYFNETYKKGFVNDLEMELQTKSREKRSIKISSELIEFDNKTNLISFLYDITNRKRNQIELNIMLKKLKRSNSELEQFAYVASHDLQEPLRMVSSFLQLLQRRYQGQLDSEANEFIKFAVDGAKRIHTLIHDLLDYSRVTSRGNEFTDVNMEETLEQALIDLKLIKEENKVNITHDNLPVIIGDYHQLIQLLENLIGNAIKYRDKENPKIHISAQEEDNQWLFSIADNGIGIDQKYDDRVFKIFQRLHTNEEYDGTGIGLAIAQRIVERHGGQIWFESELGKGSTFYFTIPNTKINDYTMFF